MFIPEAIEFIAQASAPTTQGAAPAAGSGAPAFVRFFQDMGLLFPMLLIFVLFIWMSSRSRRRQEQQKRGMLDAMKRGDRVQTIGGILGNVVEVREDRILLKVDESNNTKVWFARSAIHRVLGEDGAAAATAATPADVK